MVTITVFTLVLANIQPAAAVALDSLEDLEAM
jgi:hypothetical protein